MYIVYLSMSLFNHQNKMFSSSLLIFDKLTNESSADNLRLLSYPFLFIINILVEAMEEKRRI